MDVRVLDGLAGGILMNDLVNAGLVERRIYIIRGEKVMLDRDLAKLYGVPTKSLNLKP